MADSVTPLDSGPHWVQLTGSPAWRENRLVKSTFISSAWISWDLNEETLLAYATVSSVQFSCSVMSDSLSPQRLQHARPPCPSPTPGAYAHSHPLSRWCHPTISSSVVPFSFQSFPASGSFPMSQFFESGGQTIGVLALASVLLMNIQVWFFFRMDWLDLLAVQGSLKNLLQQHSSKSSILQCSVFFIVQLSHPYMTTGKKRNFD